MGSGGREAQGGHRAVVSSGVACGREGTAGWMDWAWGPRPGPIPAVHLLGEAPELPVGTKITVPTSRVS